MEEISTNTAKEVLTVLLNTDIMLIMKLPYKLIEFLQKKSIDYDGEIKLQEDASLDKQIISDEAKAILTLIYKDYWCDEEGRISIDRKIKAFEEEAYDPLKNKRKKMYDNKQTTTALVIPTKWYQKISDKIKKLFIVLENKNKI